MKKYSENVRYYHSSDTLYQPGDLIKRYTKGAPTPHIKVEKIFEQIRQEQFSDRPSRYTAKFIFKNYKRGGVPSVWVNRGKYLYEVQPKGKVFDADAEALNYAFENPGQAISSAISYWEGDEEQYLGESLTDDDVVVIQGPLELKDPSLQAYKEDYFINKEQKELERRKVYQELDEAKAKYGEVENLIIEKLKSAFLEHDIFPGNIIYILNKLTENSPLNNDMLIKGKEIFENEKNKNIEIANLYDQFVNLRIKIKFLDEKAESMMNEYSKLETGLSDISNYKLSKYIDNIVKLSNIYYNQSLTIFKG